MRLLPILAVAAIVAGCGGMSDADYADRVTRASETVQVAMAGAGSDAAKLDASSKAIAGAADDLAGTDPPGDAEHINDEIVGGFRKLAGTLRQAAQAARDGDFGKRDDILANLDTSPGLRQLEAARRELVKLSG